MISTYTGLKLLGWNQSASLALGIHGCKAQMARDTGLGTAQGLVGPGMDCMHMAESVFGEALADYPHMELAWMERLYLTVESQVGTYKFSFAIARQDVRITLCNCRC